MKHKKIVFDQIKDENPVAAKKKKNRDFLVYNAAMNITSGFFRVLVILIVSLLGTVLLTAIFRGEAPLDVGQELLEKCKTFFFG